MRPRVPRLVWLASLLSCAVVVLAATAAHAQLLYWLDTNYSNPSLNHCKPDGTLPASLTLGAGTLPEGLSLDATNHRVYWTESAWAGARLRRCSLDFAGVSDVVTGLSCMRGVVVNNGSSQVYALSSNLSGTGSELRRWSLDGASPIVVTLGVAANPRGAVVDGAGARLIWADFDQSALYSSPPSGSPVTLYRALAANARPYGVAIDASAAMIYWTDYAAGTISRAPLSGGAAVTVQSGLQNPTYLALDVPGSRMFWIEAGAPSNRLRRSALAGGAITALPVPVSTYGGLVYVPAASLADAPEDAPAELAFALRSGNPTRGVLALECALPRDATVRVNVLDLQGREVALLEEGALTAGRHSFTWDGRGHAPGVYFARLATGGRVLMRRVTLLN